MVVSPVKIVPTNFLVAFFVLLTNAQEEPLEELTPPTVVSKMYTVPSVRPHSTRVPPHSLHGCAPGEELRICAFCDGTCRFPVPFCGFFCSLVPRCHCQFGRLRNSRGQCIPSDECIPGQTPPAESYCCGTTGRCLHCAVGYSCVVQSGLPYCRPHWYGIGLANYYDDDIIHSSH